MQQNKQFVFKKSKEQDYYLLSDLDFRSQFISAKTKSAWTHDTA